MIADFDRKRFVRADIRRIGEDQIERALHPLPPVADPELGAIRHAEAPGVGAGIIERLLRCVHPQSACFGPLIERGEQQRAWAGAEIEDRRGCALVEMLDRGFDQRLAVGTRDEGARSDLQLDRPEGARAGDVGDGLVSQAALEERFEGLGCGIVEVAEEQVTTGDAEGVRHQEFGVEAGGVGDRGKALCGTGKGSTYRVQAFISRSLRAKSRSKKVMVSRLRSKRTVGVCPPPLHPSNCANRSASSCAISAPISSSISPSRISGRRWSVRLMRWSVTRPCGKL